MSNLLLELHLQHKYTLKCAKNIDCTRLTRIIPVFCFVVNKLNLTKKKKTVPIRFLHDSTIYINY